MRVLLACAAFLVSVPASANLIQEFKTDTTDAASFLLSGSTYIRSLTGLVADGVTFDATMTIQGTNTMNVNSNGVGVDGTGSDLVSDGESIMFSMAVSNVVGGIVSFQGFTEIDFNNFGASDSGVLSLDNSAATAGDNFFVTATGGDVEDISGTSPTLFSAIASTGALNSFRVDDVTGSFQGSTVSASVPEPSSMLLLGMGCFGYVTYRRRKRQPKSAAGSM